MPAIARTLFALLLVATTSLATAEQDWVERSNANAEPLLQVMAKYAPETAAALGVEGFDAEVFDLKPQNDLRFEADTARVADRPRVAPRGRAGPARAPGPADPDRQRPRPEGDFGTQSPPDAAVVRPDAGAVPGLQRAARPPRVEGPASRRAGPPAQVHRPRARLRADHEACAGAHRRALRDRRAHRPVDRRSRAGPAEPAAVRGRHP